MNKNNLNTILLLIIIFLIIGITAYTLLNQNNPQTLTTEDTNQELDQKSESKTDSDSEKNTSQSLPINSNDYQDTLSPQAKSVKQSLIYPQGGEIFCYGEVVQVRWNPELLSGSEVDILLNTPNSLVRLDTVYTSEGVYYWYLKRDHTTVTGEKTSATIEPDDRYNIILRSNSTIYGINMSDNFTIASLCLN